MKMMLKDVPLSAIDCDHADRARNFDPVWAEGLAALIAAQGLLHPITVRIVGERYRLVAGLHRLEAHRLLGRDSIAAMISAAESDDAARLEEVMENLGRNELKALDRCQHLYELKQVWERMYPQAKHGGDHGNQHTGGKSPTWSLANEGGEIFGFARSTAEKIGLSQTAIKRCVSIWTQLSPASRQRLPGTALAAKQTELKALSELKPADQGKVLDLILGEGFPEIVNVSTALDHLQAGSTETQVEKQFRSARKVFSTLPDAALDMVISAEADRVMASLKRLGRI